MPSKFSKNLTFFIVITCLALQISAVFSQEALIDHISGFDLNAADCVSMKTGHFTMEKEDLLVRAKEPISIKRFYSSEKRREYEGGWSFLPQTKAEFKKTSFYQKIKTKIDSKNNASQPKYRLSISLDDKTETSLEGVLHKDTQTISFSTALSTGLSSTSKTSFEDTQKNTSKLKIELDLVYCRLIVFFPDGRLRVYWTNAKTCNDLSHQILLLTMEKKPNGCKIIYSWDESDRLTEIKTISPSGKHTYGWARFFYTGSGESKHNFQIKASDGRQLQYNFTRIQRKSDKQESHYLKVLSSSFAPTEYYEYQSSHNKKGPCLESIRLPQGKIIEVKYFNIDKQKNCNLVKALKLPDSQGQMQQVYNFYYQIEKEKGENQIVLSRRTDKENNLNCYHFKQGRLTLIEYFTNQQTGIFSWSSFQTKKHSSQKFYFNPAGQLVSKALLNAEDKIVLCKHFKYDRFGRIIKETMLADLTGDNNFALNLNLLGEPQGQTKKGSYSKIYSYSNNKFNLRETEKEETGLLTEYTYLPDTNLISSQLIKDSFKNKILERYFFEYDKEHVLIKKIYDDGYSSDKDCLDGVTIRHISCIFPSEKASSLHFPETIEEKYLDLKTQEEKLLKKTVFIYTEQALLSQEKIFDSQNKPVSSINYKYNDKQLLIQKKDSTGIKKYEYDSNYNLKKEQKENRVNFFVYDQLNRLTEKSCQLEQKKEKTSFEYDYKNNIITSKNSKNAKTHYFYDSFSNCIKTIYPAVLNEHKVLIEPAVEAEYDIMGNLIKITNGCRETVQTYYTGYQKPFQIIETDGKITRHIYYQDGHLKKTIYPNGREEFFSYDLLGNLIYTKYISQDKRLLAEENWFYKGRKLIKHIAKDGLITEYFYDDSGKKIKTVQNNEKITNYKYDSLGFENCRISHLNPNQALVEVYQKNNHGQIIGERKENLTKNLFFKKNYEYGQTGNVKTIASYHQAGRAQEHFYYDYKKRPVKHSDSQGYIRSYTYKDLENTPEGSFQKIFSDPENFITLETYDALERIIALEKQTPSGEICFQARYYYDATGRQLRLEEDRFLQGQYQSTKVTEKKFKNSPDFFEITLAKDSIAEKKYQVKTSKNGRQGTFQKPSGKTLTYTYDEQGHVTAIYSSDKSINLSYRYDISGRLTEAYDLKQNLKIQRTYDGFGNLIKEKNNNFTIKKEYDLFGRLTKLILPDGSWIGYNYDECRLISIERYNAKKEKTFSYKYLKFDLSLNPLEAEIENLTPVKFKIDQAGRKCFISSRYFQQAIEQFSPSGKVLKIATHAFPSSSYGYDHLSQLTQETGFFNNFYLFDSLSNLKQKNEQEFSISEASENLSCFEYDLDGQPIYDYRKKANYQYDALGRLTVFENSIFKIEYSYDPLNRRYKKTIFSKTQNQQNAKKQHLYFINSDNLEIAAINEDQKIQDLKITEPVNSLQKIPLTLAIEIDSKLFAVLSDLQGNPAVLIDPKDKQIKESYLYSAFGEKRVFSRRRQQIKKSLIGNPFAFQSMREEEHGLLFFTNRYFDPCLASFLTPDPLGFSDSSNPYAYAQNLPLNQTDPTGFYAEKASFLTPSSAAFNMAKNNALQAANQNHLQNVVSLPCKIKLAAKNTFNVLSFPFKLIGLGLEFLSEQTPVPIVQDAIYVGGRVLQFKFSAFKLPSFNYCQPSIIKYGQFNPQANVVYVNGILNDRQEIENSGQLLSDLIEDQGQLNVFHNPTKGLFNDLMECMFLSCGFQTPVSLSLNAFLKDYLHDMDTNSRLMVVAHSGGALTLKAALKNLSEEEKQMIELRTFSPAQSISDKYAHSAINYISKKDLIGNLVGRSFSAPIFTTPYNVQKLNARESAYFIDHPFSSASYQKMLRKEIGEFFNPAF